MPTDLQQALALIKLINNWALIDIALDPAAVTACTAQPMTAPPPSRSGPPPKTSS